MKKIKVKKIILILLAMPLTKWAYGINNSMPANSRTNVLPTSNANATNLTTTTNAVNSTASNNGLSDDKVVLNFENADIQSVIKAISQLSGKNFVIDPRVKGTVNIISDKPISKADSYKVLEAALRMQGFAAVEADGVIKILPETDAKTYGMQTITGQSTIKHQMGDQVITKIFVIQHGSATQLANSLRPLIAPNNSISVYPNSNALIITDFASNIGRITKIINQLSTVGSTAQPVIVNLQNAVAADVAQVLQSYLNGGGQTSGGGPAGGNTDGPNVTITVEAATNSLIIYSPIQDKMQELKNLAEKIDKNVGAVNSDLHVVYLKNADAQHVADVLRVIAEGQENPGLTASSAQAKFATEPTSAFNMSGSSGGGGGGGGTGISSPQATATSNVSSKAGSNATTQKDAPKIIIQAEPTTNSLIIQAPQAVYKNLRMIIDMLDVRRAQVMIEAMLANINQTQSGDFGIQWAGAAGNNSVGLAAVGNYGGSLNGSSSSLSGIATSILGATAAASGSGGAAGAGGISIPNEMFVGLVTSTTTIGGQTVPTMTNLADMIDQSSAGNILTRPTLITLDNEEARIMVGANVGIPNGSYQNTAATAGSLVTTITRQDLGTVLQIKPLITQNGAIQLDIYQEDSSIDPNQPVNSPNGPSFLEQKMRTTVLVDNGQIIALGGMTQDTITLQENGIPLLDKIPYIGWLFEWQGRMHTKQNLVLFLRPVIIQNADGYRALTNERYRYVLGEQQQVQAGGYGLPGIKPVTLDNQVPYQTTATPNAGLNLNKNLPIIDLTDGGKNLNKSNPNAMSVTTTVVHPSAESASVNANVNPSNDLTTVVHPSSESSSMSMNANNPNMVNVAGSAINLTNSSTK